MKEYSDIDEQLLIIRNRARKQRLAIIAITVVIVIGCIVAVVWKHHAEEVEAQQHEQQLQDEREARLQRRIQEGRESEEAWIREMERDRRNVNSSAMPKADEPEQNNPNYTWDDLETMVRNLTNEDYYASVWWVERDTPKWVVLYTKGGKEYFRHLRHRSLNFHIAGAAYGRGNFAS